MHELKTSLLANEEGSQIPPRAYMFMIFTILLEVSGTLTLRRTVNDFRAYFPAYALYFAGFSMFSFTLRYIPLSIAYATWCALGTIGVSISSCFLYNETLSYAQWVCMFMLLAPMLGLYLCE